MVKQNVVERMRQLQLTLLLIVVILLLFGGCGDAGAQEGRIALKAAVWQRSEERRVGKECG